MEKERERNISVWLPLTHPLLGTWPATQAHALTGNRTGNLPVLRLALNALSHTSQGNSVSSLTCQEKCTRRREAKKSHLLLCFSDYFK